MRARVIWCISKNDAFPAFLVRQLSAMAPRLPRSFNPMLKELMQAAASDDVDTLQRHAINARRNREWLAFVAVKYGSLDALRWLRLRNIRDPAVHSDLKTLALSTGNDDVINYLDLVMMVTVFQTPLTLSSALASRQ